MQAFDKLRQRRIIELLEIYNMQRDSSPPNRCLNRVWSWIADRTYRKCLTRQYLEAPSSRQEENSKHFVDSLISPPPKQSEAAIFFALSRLRLNFAIRTAATQQRKPHLLKKSIKNIESENKSQRKKKQPSFCALKSRPRQEIGTALLKKYVDLRKHEKPTSLLCPICFDLFAGSTVLNCGHAFCRECIDEGMLTRPVCPLCRTEANWGDIALSNCIQIETALQVYLRLFAPDDQIQQSYAERRLSLTNWSKRRSTSQLQVSSIIDYCIKSNLWQKGEITGIFFEGNSKWFQIREKRLGGSTIRVQANSNMLARGGFYTSRPNYVAYQSQLLQIEFLNTGYQHWLNLILTGVNMETPIDLLPQIQQEVELQQNEEEEEWSEFDVNEIELGRMQQPIWMGQYIPQQLPQFSEEQDSSSTRERREIQDEQ